MDSRESAAYVPGSTHHALATRIEALERALRIIELEVYGRPEPFCRRIAAEIVEVLGVAPE
jgi:hypothetical protein